MPVTRRWVCDYKVMGVLLPIGKITYNPLNFDLSDIRTVLAILENSIV